MAYFKSQCPPSPGTVGRPRSESPEPAMKEEAEEEANAAAKPGELPASDTLFGEPCAHSGFGDPDTGASRVIGAGGSYILVPLIWK